MKRAARDHDMVFEGVERVVKTGNKNRIMKVEHISITNREYNGTAASGMEMCGTIPQDDSVSWSWRE